MSYFDPATKPQNNQNTNQNNNTGNNELNALKAQKNYQNNQNNNNNNNMFPGATTTTTNNNNQTTMSAIPIQIDMNQYNNNNNNGNVYGNNASYPEALPNNNNGEEDYNMPPVQGEPLFTPQEVADEPALAKFKKNGLQDWPFAAAFLAVFLFSVIYGIVCYASYEIKDRSNNYGETSPLYELKKDVGSATIVVSLIIVGVVSMLVGMAILVLLFFFPAKLIYIANIASAVLMFIAAIVSFAQKNIVGGIFLLVLAALQVLWTFLCRSRIAFSAELLRMASFVVQKFKMLLLVNALLTVLSFVYVMLWSGAIVPSVDRMYTSRIKGVDYFLFLWFAFTLFWVAQVIPNVMHTTTAGVTATWYFVGAAKLQDHNQNNNNNEFQPEGAAGGEEKDKLNEVNAYPLPPTVTIKSFFRAITISFGSVCFGSLLVAIIQFIQFLVRSSQHADGNNNACITLLRCVAVCLLDLLERMVRFFNQYAFVYVAVYGTSYIESAKRTFHLLKNCFFSAYINDCLVEPTLQMLAVAAAALIGVATGFALHRSIYIGLVAFFISLLVIYVFLTPVMSAVTTLFVCFAEMPEGLQQCNPALYRRLREADEQGRVQQEQQQQGQP